MTQNNSYKEKEDSVTEERIANILNEAQVAMHMKKSLEQVLMIDGIDENMSRSLVCDSLSLIGRPGVFNNGNLSLCSGHESWQLCKYEIKILGISSASIMSTSGG